MIRYNVTHIQRDGLRVLLGPAQGRFMKDTREEAEESLRALLASNSSERLASLYGQQSIGTFRVDSFECWDHGDPKRIYVVASRASQLAGDHDSPCPLHEGYHCQLCCPECRFVPLVEIVVLPWIPGDSDKTIQTLEAFNGEGPSYVHLKGRAP